MMHYSVIHPEKTDEMLASVYKQARQVAPIDLRSLSEISHEIGMALSEGSTYDLKTAAGYCGLAFKGACLHGFVMENLEKPAIEASYSGNFLKYCDILNNTSTNEDYLNCLHGAGHELWAQNSLSLQDTLASCDSLPDFKTKSSCMSGVFMEYSKGSMRQGHHSHIKVGVQAPPCANLSDSLQKSVCYASAGSYFQYEPDTQPLKATMEYCLNSPAKYRDDCLSEVYSRLLFGAGGDVNAATVLCKSLQAEYAAMCSSSLHGKSPT
jgi:hypothetical protein